MVIKGNEMTSQWHTIECSGATRPPLSVRVYKKESEDRTPPLVLYLRGGSFLEQGGECPELPVAQALADSGAVVIEADYSTSSCNEFPAVIDCAFEALDCLSRSRKHYGGAKSLLFVAGEEAGGNVAAGLALKARDRMPGKLAGQILLSPMIDPLMASTSFRDADKIGMRQRWAEGWSHYLAKACGFAHPYAAPCLCTRLNLVAPALIFTAEDDPLRDETVNYAGRLSDAGVKVRQHVFPAGSGWTGLYRGEGGKWLSAVCTEFAGFVQDLKH
jgi:acetyl esterase